MRWSRPNFLRRRIHFNEYKAVMVGNSGAIWTEAGGLTLSRSQTSFQNSISALYSYRAPVQPALRPLCSRLHDMYEPVLCLICGVWAKHVQRCSEQASRYNTRLTDRTAEAGCDEWQSFLFFWYYAYPIILNDRLCRIYLIFSAALFTELTARC